MKCNICDSKTKYLFETKILSKYDVKYFQCENCNFIQTEKVFWLNEAYSSAITNLDLGYVTRNIRFTQIVKQLLKYCYSYKPKYLDYGGGYGLFVRLMRDCGFDFKIYDEYCDNIFAKGFEINLDKNQNFELITMFEVAEHLENPIEIFEKLLNHSSNILFSTEIIPKNKTITSVNDWWYFIPSTGQHISLFSENSLKSLAIKFNLNYYGSRTGLHLFTKRKFLINPIALFCTIQYIKDKILKTNFMNPKSLINSDLSNIKNEHTI